MNNSEIYKTLDPLRAVSWSMLSSFKWNPDQWWRKYVAGELPELTKELIFGSMIDKKIQEDKKFLPKVVRYPVLQHAMKAEFNGIPLVGVTDAFRLKKPSIRDYKTGRVPWTQKRADETGQLTMYCLLAYLTEKIKPEDVSLFIDWLPTHIKDGEIVFREEDHRKLVPVTFETRRSMKDMLEFGQFIMDTYAAMLEYCKHRPVLDTCSYAEF